MGPGWMAGRVLYALKIRSGWLKRRTPCHDWKNDAPTITGRYFKVPPNSVCHDQLPDNEADAILQGRFRFFSKTAFQCGLPPNWLASPFEDKASSENQLNQGHWSRIGDFSHDDIKCIWELSRFAWVFPLVRSYQATGNEIYAQACLNLIDSWRQHNPPNRGVHWKCGQEIAIRMFALVTACFSFPNTDPDRKTRIAEIIFESAKRIAANIGYALSQQNNHGVSEASGLFTAGILFAKEKWVKKGAGHLENQIQALVSADGSFSQHSANYHRVMLHACLWAIQLGRANGFTFSDAFTARIRKAGAWLLALYDPQTGQMPNLGSNDGALILPYSVCGYLDYRPTIQAVGAVVDGKRWLPVGRWDDLALWLVPGLGQGKENLADRGIQVVSPSFSKGCNTGTQLKILEDGGYAIWSDANRKLIFRCPQRFRFRPAQCDLLHVDLWAGGINLLRDAGTYSYNCSQPWQDYFKSAAAHNTIQFDDHDQMPEISRFLYGQWPRLEVRYEKESDPPYIEAGFTDWTGCYHRRSITFFQNSFKVVDTIEGNFKKAVLRWRLTPELDWNLDGDGCTADRVSLAITSPVEKAINLTEGWESLHYMEKTPLPVMETIVGPDCREISTFFSLK
jgi:hypothetical protein